MAHRVDVAEPDGDVRGDFFHGLLPAQFPAGRISVMPEHAAICRLELLPADHPLYLPFLQLGKGRLGAHAAFFERLLFFPKKFRIDP